MTPDDEKLLDAIAWRMAFTSFCDAQVAREPVRFLCAGTRAVAGPCRTTAEEEPRECSERKWWVQPVGRGAGLAFSEAPTVGYGLTLEAGTERAHFNVDSGDTPEDLERKVREAVWRKAGK